MATKGIRMIDEFLDSTNDRDLCDEKINIPDCKCAFRIPIAYMDVFWCQSDELAYLEAQLVGRGLQIEREPL